MNRLTFIKNFGRFSFLVDLFSWAIPLNIDRYPGAKGWTYRVSVLCFNLQIRTESGYGDKPSLYTLDKDDSILYDYASNDDSNYDDSYY